jgi:hypothetical protein
MHHVSTPALNIAAGTKPVTDHNLDHERTAQLVPRATTFLVLHRHMLAFQAFLQILIVPFPNSSVKTLLFDVSTLRCVSPSGRLS